MRVPNYWEVLVVDLAMCPDAGQAEFLAGLADIESERLSVGMVAIGEVLESLPPGAHVDSGTVIAIGVLLASLSGLIAQLTSFRIAELRAPTTALSAASQE